MRILQINGYTRQEAIENESPFFIQKDATAAWKKAGKPLPTSPEFKEFAVEYLAEKTKNAPGIGCSVTYDAGVADTRDKPYKIDDVANEQGKRKYKTTYLLIDEETNEILAKCQETKAKAKEVARELYTKDKFKGNIVCKYTKEVIEGEPLAFKVKHTPGKNTKQGTYIVFGIDQA